MYKEVDARGLQCPLPAIHTKKALDSIDKGKVTTIVDNEIAKENISKLAASMDLKVDIKENQGIYFIDIMKEYSIHNIESMEVQCDDIPKKDLAIIVSKNRLGEGAEELGQILMKGYIYSLTEILPYPKTIIFLNSGVKLTTEGSEVISYLRKMEAAGVEIISCGTCLDYFKVKNALMVGSIGNMYAIVEKSNNAKNTIKL